MYLWANNRVKTRANTRLYMYPYVWSILLTYHTSDSVRLLTYTDKKIHVYKQFNIYIYKDIYIYIGTEASCNDKRILFHSYRDFQHRYTLFLLTSKLTVNMRALLSFMQFLSMRNVKWKFGSALGVCGLSVCVSTCVVKRCCSCVGKKRSWQDIW